MAINRSKKILIAFLGILLLFIGIATVGTGFLFQRANNLKKEFGEYIKTNPNDVAIVTYTIDDHGKPVQDQYAIYHNADQPLVLGSTFKLAVLAAYADAVSSGSLDPNEQVPVTEWEKYYVPLTDAGAHAQGLKSIGLEVDELGFAVDQKAVVSLNEIARIMIHYSGNAATDYLLTRIGKDGLNITLSKAGLEHQTPIRLILGAVLVMFNHEYNQPDINQLQAIINEVSSGNTEYVDRLVYQYLNDPDWRDDQIQHMANYSDTVILPEEEMWAYQEVASQLFPKGTAREYAQFSAQIARGKLISTEASEIIQQHLENVPSDWPLRLLYFDKFGAKDGVTAGVLTIASYAIPKRNDLAEQYRVVVILANHMPMNVWASQLQFEGHYLLQADLAQATGIFGDIRVGK